MLLESSANGAENRAKLMGDVWKKTGDDELRAIRWDRFWEGVWIGGAVIALLVLASLSGISVVDQVTAAFT
jgi:hypothetical protein